MSLNSVYLQGRMTADPVLRQTSTLVSFVSFTVAVSRDFKGADGERQTDFINCTAWRATAEFINSYFQKGSPILVHGRLRQNSWTAEDGSKRTSYDVIADNVYFCGPRTDGASRDIVGFTETDEDEPLPF